MFMLLPWLFLVLFHGLYFSCVLCFLNLHLHPPPLPSRDRKLDLSMDVADFFQGPTGIHAEEPLHVGTKMEGRMGQHHAETAGSHVPLRIFFEEGGPDQAETISHLPCPTEYVTLPHCSAEDISLPLCPAEDAIKAHGLAIGITPSP